MKRISMLLVMSLYIYSVNLLSLDNKISKISIKESTGKVELNVQGTQKPTFTVFKLRNPLRLIIDISNASIEGIESPINVNNEIIKQIITSQFEDDINMTSRIMLSLKKDSKYSVKSIGNRFVLYLEDNSISGSRYIVKKRTNFIEDEKDIKKEKEIKNIQSKLLQKEQEIKRIESLLKDKEKAISQKENNLEKRNKELNSLRTELFSLKSSLNRTEELNKSLAFKLNKKDELLKVKDNKISLLSGKLVNNNQKIRNNQKEIDVLSKKLNNGNTNLNSNTKKNKDLKEKLNLLLSENKKLKSKSIKMTTSLSNLKNGRDTIAREKKNIDKKLRKEKENYLSLKKEYSKILNKNTRVEKEKKALLAENKKLKANLNSKSNVNNDKLMTEKKRIENENTKLKKQLASLIANQKETLRKERSIKNNHKNIRLNDLKVLKYKNKVVVNLNINNYSGDFEIRELTSPKRIVVDLPNTKMNKNLKKNIEFKDSLLSAIRLGSGNNGSRVVIDINNNNNIPKYFLKKDKNILKLTLLTNKKVLTNNLIDADTKKTKDYTSIVLKFDSKVKYTLIREDSDLAVIKFFNLKTPERLQNTMEIKDRDSVVKMASIFQSSNDTILAVKLQHKSDNSFTIKNNIFVWKFKTIKNNILVKKESNNIKYLTTQTASYQANVAYGSSPKRKYYGKRISIDFKNADIHDVLELIADVSKINIITSDDVAGTVTVRLRNVQWDKALDVILKTKGLGKEILGNIIRVAPLSVLSKELQDRIDMENKKKDNIPLSVRLIPVSYAHADELVEQVKGILSKRGKVTVDVRTNVLIVKDLVDRLDNAEALIKNLDTETPQVLIEGRIVEASSSFSTEKGIQWGGGIELGPKNGSQTGLYFPSSIGAVGYKGTDNWVTNLPSSGAEAAGGGVSLSLGSVNDSINLKLRIAAAEAEGKLKIVSSPRISTLDNKEALIETGIKIPIMTLNEQGVPASKLIDAKIKLIVTPHITADGSIILKVEMIKEEPDFSRVNALGDPAIISKNAKTELLIKDGETAVIGGMYTKKLSDEEKRVPLLGSIPVLGWFFKSTKHIDERSELLIFITPRIINRNNTIINK